MLRTIVVFAPIIAALAWVVFNIQKPAREQFNRDFLGKDQSNLIDKEVIVIGAGLAGSEAAWQVANSGVPVKLVEMRPLKSTPAHHTSEFGELVCSNSFGALSPDRASGLLQKELRTFNSLIIKMADKFAVPAGGALSVDRSKFSNALTEILSNHPLIEIKRFELML